MLDINDKSSFFPCPVFEEKRKTGVPFKIVVKKPFFSLQDHPVFPCQIL